MVDDPRARLPLAPEAMPIREENRRRLEQLLRELLRDETIRRLFCHQQERTSQPLIESTPRRLRISLRLVTGEAR